MSKLKLINHKTVVVLLFCVISIIAMLHHEQWRDEAQTWLIAGSEGARGVLIKTRL